MEAKKEASTARSAKNGFTSDKDVLKFYGPVEDKRAWREHQERAADKAPKALADLALVAASKESAWVVEHLVAARGAAGGSQPVLARFLETLVARHGLESIPGQPHMRVIDVIANALSRGLVDASPDGLRMSVRVEGTLDDSGARRRLADGDRLRLVREEFYPHLNQHRIKNRHDGSSQMVRDRLPKEFELRGDYGRELGQPVADGAEHVGAGNPTRVHQDPAALKLVQRLQTPVDMWQALRDAAPVGPRSPARALIAKAKPKFAAQAALDAKTPGKVGAKSLTPRKVTEAGKKRRERNAAKKDASKGADEARDDAEPT